MLLQDRLDQLQSQATLFLNGDHFDKDNIRAKQVEVVSRYQKLAVGIFSYPRHSVLQKLMTKW